MATTWTLSFARVERERPEAADLLRLCSYLAPDDIPRDLLAGGVAANTALRAELRSKLQTPLLFPDIQLCTDNAAMIASAAYYWQEPADNPYKLTVIPSI